jgi:very-short-patch-repair endonuclease
MRRILEQLHVPFISQEPIKTQFSIFTFIVDFLVQRRIVIEVKGRYWRRKQRRRDKDEAKKHCLEAEGFRVLEFWDDEVFKQPDSVRQTVKEALSGK